MTEDSGSRQLELLKFLVEQSSVRLEWSAARSYLNSERTLGILIHTALALMIFGIAIDRFGLFVHRLPWLAAHGLPDTPSWESVMLISLGVLLALVAGVRYLFFISAYSHNRHMPLRGGAFLPPIFALLFAAYGVALLVVILVH
jgi:putative membrane protein